MLPCSDSDSEQLTGDSEVYEDALADHQEVLMSLSKYAMDGVEAPKSLRLVGNIQGHEVIILLDSGSSNNFISARLATQLTGVQEMAEPVTVRVAGGGLLKGTLEIPHCTWSCQGKEFNTNLKVLPLHSYDVILGMQWLEQLGLMTTHWAEKWFEFEWEGHKCRLQGISSNTSSCEVISEVELQALHQQDVIYYMVHVQAIAEKFS